MLKALLKVCIVDLDFYDKNVLVQLEKLRTAYPTIKLIAHSNIDEEKVVRSILELGSSSYLLVGNNVDDFRKTNEM